MKRLLGFLAVAALTFSVSTALGQPYRPFGAGALVLDDNSGHQVTITSPQPGDPGYAAWIATLGPHIWTVPIPPFSGATQGFVLTGPQTGTAPKILIWDYPTTAGGTGGPQGTWRPADLTTIGAVSGVGTTNLLSKWTSPTTLGNSSITDNGTTISTTEGFSAGAATFTSLMVTTGPETFSNLGLGVVHSSASGVLSSSLVNLATDVTGTLPNTSLSNSYFNVLLGPGLNGSASVSLGGTLNLTNTGVTSISGTTNEINVSGNTGAVTISLPDALYLGDATHPGFVNLSDGSSNWGNLSAAPLSVNRNWMFPNNSGTVALLSDIPSATGSTSITTVGTITTGVWNGSTITVPYGGTGATSFTAGVIHSPGGTAALTSGPVNLETEVTGHLPNTNLANSQITINTGTGLSGGGAVALGGILSLTNTGVTSITGTANEIVASASTGAVTLSLPNTINLGDNSNAGGINIYDGTSNFGLLNTLPLSANQTWSLPNQSGTIALLSDIPGASGSTAITTVGTITTGTWHGSTIQVPWGGTGATTFTAGVIHSPGGTANLTSGPVNLATEVSGLLPNTNLANSSLTVTAGTGLSGGGSVSLGGSVTLNNAGVTSIAGTANEIVASASTGAVTLSLPDNVVLGDATHSGTLALYNGSANTGTFVTAPLNANRTYTLPNNSGTVALTSDLTGFAGSTNITTLGTITTGTWNGTVITPTYGGTGISAYAAGDILYATNSTTLARLPIGSAGQVLTVTSGFPAWSTSSVSNTFANITLTDETNQITLGNTTGSNHTITLTGPSLTGPAANRTYTIPDAGANASFVMTQGGLQGLQGSYDIYEYGTHPSTNTSTAASMDNVATTGTSNIYITSQTAPFQITGFANGFDGKRLRVYNATSYDMTIANMNTSSSIGNRINTLAGGDVTLVGNGAAEFVYDATTGFWVSTANLASNAEGLIGNTTFGINTSDFATTNTTLTNDPQIKFRVGANQTWELSGTLVVTQTANNKNFQMAFSVPGTGSDMLVSYIGFQPSSSGFGGQGCNVLTANATANGSVSIPTGTNVIINYTGIINTGSIPGTVYLQVAQVNSGGTLTVLQNSFIRATRTR